MWISKSYKMARKRFKQWLNARSSKKKSILPSKSKLGIKRYLNQRKLSPLPKARYLRRFRQIPQSIYEDFAEGIITKMEWDMFQLLPNFKGYFNNLFEFNDLSYFDDLQEKLEINGKDFKDIFLYDIIALELLRRQLGFRDFTGLEKMGNF